MVTQCAVCFWWRWRRHALSDRIEFAGSGKGHEEVSVVGRPLDWLRLMPPSQAQSADARFCGSRAVCHSFQIKRADKDQNTMTAHPPAFFDNGRNRSSNLYFLNSGGTG
jgi:hypothetical protein